MKASSGVATPQKGVSLVAPYIGEEEIAGVVAVLRSGQLAQGPIVAEFEREFAEIIGVRHAVAVNSGTAANHCGLAGLGIRAGDEVLSTPFTFAASATPILMQGATVRFVDIDERTFNVDLANYAAVAGESTKGIAAVDLFGLPFDRAGAAALATRGIRVLEDACQAIGSVRDGVTAGSDCDAAGFSFYATKNLMMGEGGVLVTNSDEVAATARRFRQHGQGDRYEYLELGYNYRLTDVLAAVGRAQLRRLDDFAKRRRANAAFYDANLASLDGLLTPYVPAGVVHGYHQYCILIDGNHTKNGNDRDAVREVLTKLGIASGIYYPKPLHLHPLFGGPHRAGEFPVSERVAKQIIALPIHPTLTESELERVVDALKTAVSK